ncbi:glycine-tRNA synthetase subunit alpha [Salmonella enterica subsp. arizonae]|uniref:Glycine--tRNA ligase alpha subunit n=1 Tax=Salmonella enterica subsp. arizonae TaxID=59203 RepID=A0A447QWJ7_SALER|nr:glycine-tRNA synthetase subunit alpha [Salmonella enterica subsp. arizonae]
MFHQNEVEQSTYNFEYADVDFLFTCFEQYEKEAQQLLALENPLPLPAYERILKAAIALTCWMRVKPSPSPNVSATFCVFVP